MRVRDARGAAAAALTIVVMQACVGAGATSQPEPAGRPSADEVAALEALYRARADSARMSFTEADVEFMQGMIVHHAQALAMSGLAPGRSASEAVRVLASRTINAQNDEIATMRAWLEDRGQVVPMHEMASMPGMLTDEQMSELEAARGEAFDRLFLTYMIQHHSGAVAMVHELFATDGAALGDTVFKIASDIQVDQTTEINRMESMLEAMSEAGSRP